ncbi:SDR family NAD(P)-dependent oxidoreductase, partial [Georgenia thermotolerans]
MGRVEDKVVVISGGAVGLGAAAARLLAEEGARVVITDVADTVGEQTAESIRAEGGEALSRGECIGLGRFRPG